jgi:cell fate regulator YaaT (PSP1 superfamily)
MKQRKLKGKRDGGVTLEVSIVGGGFSRYKAIKPVKIIPGHFVLLQPEGEDKELLVKVRNITRNQAEKAIKSIRPASKDYVMRIMKNMAKGVIWESGLEDLKIVEVSLDLRVGVITFTYIAEKKHTLARLAARLAKVFHLRVDFNQIGARDYARKIGGIGRCGRMLCCRTFLKEIPSVTLDMARNQYIFAAPEKLSGACGRLLCCLRFELPLYEMAQKILPPLGAWVETESGVGKVVEIQVPLLSFKIQYEDNRTELVKVEGEERNWKVIRTE